MASGASGSSDESDEAITVDVGDTFVDVQAFMAHVQAVSKSILPNGSYHVYDNGGRNQGYVRCCCALARKKPPCYFNVSCQLRPDGSLKRLEHGGHDGLAIQTPARKITARATQTTEGVIVDSVDSARAHAIATIRRDHPQATVWLKSRTNPRFVCSAKGNTNKGCRWSVCFQSQPNGHYRLSSQNLVHNGPHPGLAGYVDPDLSPSPEHAPSPSPAASPEVVTTDVQEVPAANHPLKQRKKKRGAQPSPALQERSDTSTSNATPSSSKFVDKPATPSPAAEPMDVDVSVVENRAARKAAKKARKEARKAQKEAKRAAELAAAPVPSPSVHESSPPPKSEAREVTEAPEQVSSRPPSDALAPAVPSTKRKAEVLASSATVSTSSASKSSTPKAKRKRISFVELFGPTASGDAEQAEAYQAQQQQSAAVEQQLQREPAPTPVAPVNRHEDFDREPTPAPIDEKPRKKRKRRNAQSVAQGEEPKPVVREVIDLDPPPLIEFLAQISSMLMNTLPLFNELGLNSVSDVLQLRKSEWIELCNRHIQGNVTPTQLILLERRIAAKLAD